MSWKSLQAAGRLQSHATSKQEQDELRSVVERDLADAALPGLSDDRSFATAYNAVLQLAKMAIAAAGYRVVGQAHHQTTFQAVELAVGSAAAPYATYFDACRRKRNQLDYDVAQVASHTEAQELLRQAHEFRQLVESWLTANHPTLVHPRSS
jgi:uncharacterized protein (UPF0332 family)